MRAIAKIVLHRIAEMNLAVICPCFLLLKPFLKHHLPTLLGVTSRGDYEVRNERSGLGRQSYRTRLGS